MSSMANVLFIWSSMSSSTRYMKLDVSLFSVCILIIIISSCSLNDLLYLFQFWLEIQSVWIWKMCICFLWECCIAGNIVFHFRFLAYDFPFGLNVFLIHIKLILLIHFISLSFDWKIDITHTESCYW